jgi:hypothetical protein
VVAGSQLTNGSVVYLEVVAPLHLGALLLPSTSSSTTEVTFEQAAAGE